jgi:hypothetical protein
MCRHFEKRHQGRLARVVPHEPIWRVSNRFQDHLDLGATRQNVGAKVELHKLLRQEIVPGNSTGDHAGSHSSATNRRPRGILLIRGRLGE